MTKIVVNPVWEDGLQLLGDEADTSTLVPYTGATTDVNLGTFDLVATEITADIGTLGYINITDETNGYQIDGAKILTNEGTNNLMIGESAGTANVTQDNLCIGYEAGLNMENAAGYAGKYNIFAGYQAGKGAAGNRGHMNIGIGYQSQLVLNDGYDNVSIGHQTMATNNNGVGNIAIGTWALNKLLSTVGGDKNIAIGKEAMKLDDGGSDNIFIGYRAGYRADNSAINNVGIGVSNQQYTYNNDYNTSVGGYALQHGNCEKTTAIGGRALYSCYGNNNTALGYAAGEDVTTGTGNVFIGYMAGEGRVTTQNDNLYIANSDTATPLILGTFPNTLLTFTATNVNVVGTLKATTYQSSDASPGIDQVVTILDGDAATTHTLTFKDGLLTAYTSA